MFLLNFNINVIIISSIIIITLIKMLLIKMTVISKLRTISEQRINNDMHN